MLQNSFRKMIPYEEVHHRKSNAAVIDEVFAEVTPTTRLINLASLSLNDRDMPLIIEHVKKITNDFGLFICLSNNFFKSARRLRLLLAEPNVAFVDIMYNSYTKGEWSYQDYNKLILMVPFSVKELDRHHVPGSLYDIIYTTHWKFFNHFMAQYLDPECINTDFNAWLDVTMKESTKTEAIEEGWESMI